MEKAGEAIGRLKDQSERVDWHWDVARSEIIPGYTSLKAQRHGSAAVYSFSRCPEHYWCGGMGSLLLWCRCCIQNPSRLWSTNEEIVYFPLPLWIVYIQHCHQNLLCHPFPVQLDGIPSSHSFCIQFLFI